MCVIDEMTLCVRSIGARVEDFAGMSHLYPTMSEALKIVSLSFTKDVSRLSCCA
jgi:mercuric reductase